MKTIAVNTENKSIDLTISLPFVDMTIGGAPSRPNGDHIIYAYKMILLEALEARMEACYTNLQNHLKDIIFSDQFRIVYRRENDTTHSFNIPSYKAMEECRKVLLTRDTHKIWNGIKDNPQWAEQLCKALYWVKPENHNGQCFGDLISCLMEVAMVNKKSPCDEA